MPPPPRAPRSGRVAARGGGCATGACRYRANHRRPRFHAGESKSRPQLTRCMHQRERILLSEQPGPSLCARRSFISRHPLQARRRLLDHRHPPPRPSVPRRLVLHARSAVQWFARWKWPPRHHCNRDRRKPVAILHVEKIPRHIQDRLLFVTKGAAPALCCGAGVGPRRPRNPGGRCGPITKASILK
jgi:hypothetical protein